MNFRLCIVVSALVLCGAPAFAQDAPEPTAARDLPRGVELAPADVEGDAAGLIGWVTRRAIAEGESLRHPAIAPPQIVRSGETVQLVWRQSGMEIRMSGRAMGSAAAGETVLVRVDTQRRFEGVAYAPGEVHLAPPETN